MTGLSLEYFKLRDQFVEMRLENERLREETKSLKRKLSETQKEGRKRVKLRSLLSVF